METRNYPARDLPLVDPNAIEAAISAASSILGREQIHLVREIVETESRMESLRARLDDAKRALAQVNGYIRDIEGARMEAGRDAAVTRRISVAALDWLGEISELDVDLGGDA